MKIFEDLIEELKEENLIEETVMETGNVEVNDEEVLEKPPPESVTFQDASETPREENKVITNNYQAGTATNADSGNVILPANAKNENDFYRRRAMEEVSSLQMVERILTAVERDQAKVLPKPYNDLAVSKALHDFLQISSNHDNPEIAAAEFKLMQETESWYSALSHRDQNLLPAHLRRYCETVKPALSSQALVALARFYRNSPYSEAVRSKFDLVITRLFSKETEDDYRKLIFNHSELMQHLAELYADWSSVPLYSTDDDTELTLAALKFEDFIHEAENAADFEDLVRTDFFNRLRAFKESAGENFFAPLVAATAVNCNIQVGNRYVELLAEEKKKNNAAALEDKYSQMLDQTISEATSKTLQLVNLLKEENIVEEEAKAQPVEIKIDSQIIEEPVEAPKETVKKEKSFFSLKSFHVNKWLLALMIFTFAGTLLLYSWVEFVNPEPTVTEAQALEMDGYYFKEYLQVAKVSNETLIGVASPEWFQLNGEKKEETLRNLMAIGKEKGFKSVRIISREGKTVGYINESNITSVNSKKEPKF
jgi:hypothetical protein